MNNFYTKKLILEIKDILRNYPEYDEVSNDEQNNIIIKKKVTLYNKRRDTITEIIKKLIKEDLK